MEIIFLCLAISTLLFVITVGLMSNKTSAKYPTTSESGIGFERVLSCNQPISSHIENICGQDFNVDTYQYNIINKKDNTIIATENENEYYNDDYDVWKNESGRVIKIAPKRENKWQQLSYQQ